MVTPSGIKEPKVAFNSIQPSTKKVNNVFVSYYKDIPHVRRIVTRTHSKTRQWVLFVTIKGTVDSKCTEWGCQKIIF